MLVAVVVDRLGRLCSEGSVDSVVAVEAEHAEAAGGRGSCRRLVTAVALRGMRVGIRRWVATLR